MPWSLQQRRIVRDSMLACLVCAVVLGAGYIWLPPALFGLDGQLGIGDRVAFALKADLPVFLWLADCVRAVSKGRFLSQADIQGSAFSRPSPAIELRVAVLQNSLEQTVLAVPVTSRSGVWHAEIHGLECSEIEDVAAHWIGRLGSRARQVIEQCRGMPQ